MCIAIYYIKFENQNYPKIIFTLFLYLFVCEHTGNNLSLRRKFRLTFYYSDMPLTNNVMIVRHKLLTNLIKLWKDNQLVERIDRLPIELSPRTSRVLGRCCVHKERAVWKYKSFPLMGFDMSDETDELTPLSEYARKALERKGQQQKDNILCVIDEACSSCVQTNYEITNLCKGCVARACATNCPKKRHRIQSCRQSGHQPRSLHQLRHLPQQLPLPCHRLYARTVRRGLPRKGDYQGRTRRGAYR